MTDIFQMNEEKIHFFLDQFNRVLAQYDYIFFDMGAGATRESLFYILSADECFVVTTPEPTAMMDAYAMIKHVHARNNDLPFYLIMNRVQAKKEGMMAIERLKRVVYQFLNKDIMSLGQLSYDKIVSKAVSKQTPFILSDPKSTIAKDIHDLMSHYLINPGAEPTTQTSGFISKLKKLIKER
ncbi:MinD/ParA family protein [Halolactibacillus sp. JCM 19043]|uniref:MinD/ParA family protein n=1 Tax=Halolactibacillus sp. JCM 19043 TaxID=1460638 RepID=UPI0007840369|nr:MinD/ParA family protein [Halolactibacillus sp. JCM 19043]